MKIAFKTDRGVSFLGSVEDFTRLSKFSRYSGKVNLIFTSPPFPLNRKKAYGNLSGELYVQWITKIMGNLARFLSEDGSMVVEIGNAWNKGEPTMSTLPLKTLISIQESSDLYLCQTFVWNNPAKLPSPAPWVNRRRIRVKDSFTHIWWFSRSPMPKASNRNILIDYSASMKKLLLSKNYNSGSRPSEHKISKDAFLKNNKGAIPGNVITASNTNSNSSYLRYCKNQNLIPHPARMPEEVVKYFVNFLTVEDDLIFDPFGGSNTTGAVAEKLNRKWISTELNKDYLLGSVGRFESIKKLYI